MAIYLLQVPTYSLVYGAFAALPILLVWIYVTWLIVLLGAVVAASLPDLGRRTWRQPEGAGWDFRLALEVLTALNAAKATESRGLSTEALAERLKVETGALRAVTEVLCRLDWVGRLNETQGQPSGRLVLLVDPMQVLAAPLAERLLLAQSGASAAVWRQTGMHQMTLAQLLPLPGERS
jgi:membrane protein